MLICRYAGADGPQWGLIEDQHIYLLEGDPFSRTALEAATHSPELRRGPLVGAVEELKLLAPAAPGKIIGVGRNYAAHAAELGNVVPDEPLLFLKPSSSVIGPGDAIELLPETGRVDIEAELAVVIGRRARFVEPENALSTVFGYTCANDVSDRDFQQKDKQWVRAKGFDSFCPLGPWISTDLNPSHVTVRSRVNGEPRQDGHTSHMIFDIPRLIVYISRVMTLEPDDVILTGTPEGVSQVRDGDEVEVEVEGIGVLRNPVVGLQR